MSFADQRRADMRALQRTRNQFYMPAILNYARQKADQTLRMGLIQKDIDYQQQLSLEQMRQETKFKFDKRRLEYSTRLQLATEAFEHRRKREEYQSFTEPLARKLGLDVAPSSRAELDAYNMLSQIKARKLKIQGEAAQKLDEKRQLDRLRAYLGGQLNTIEERLQQAPDPQAKTALLNRRRAVSNTLAALSVAGTSEQVIEILQEQQQLAMDREDQRVDALQKLQKARLAERKFQAQEEDRAFERYTFFGSMLNSEAMEYNPSAVPDIYKQTAEDGTKLDKIISYPQFKQMFLGRLGGAAAAGVGPQGEQIAGTPEIQRQRELAARAHQKGLGPATLEEIVEAKSAVIDYGGDPDDVVKVEWELQQQVGKTHLHYPSGHYLPPKELAQRPESLTPEEQVEPTESLTPEEQDRQELKRRGERQHAERTKRWEEERRAYLSEKARSFAPGRQRGILGILGTVPDWLDVIGGGPTPKPQKARWGPSYEGL